MSKQNWPSCVTVGSALHSSSGSNLRLRTAFEPFDLQVMLVVTIARVAQFVRSLHIGPDFFEVALMEVIALTGHSLL